MPCIRIGVLELHHLNVEHFPTVEEALAAADKLIAHQRMEIQGVTQAHPDRIIGDPLLDQFWFCKHSGIMGMIVGGVVGVWGGSKGAMRVTPSLEIHMHGRCECRSFKNYRTYCINLRGIPQ